MGNVEKYGLLALFALCALIVGVGIFGDDGSAKKKWEPSDPDRAVGVDGAGVDDVPDWQRAAHAGVRTEPATSGDRLEPVPSRDRSFPKDAELWTAEPKVLESDGSAGGKPAEVRKQEAARIVVRKGDSFERIAVRELGSRKHTAALMAANPDIEPKRLRPGQLLERPVLAGPGTGPAPASETRSYRVRKGDTLQKISRRFYRTTRFAGWIAEANGMGLSDLLTPDRVLTIPPRPQADK